MSREGVSKLEVEGEAHGEGLVLLVSDVGQREASAEVDADGVAQLVFEEGFEEAGVGDLELAGEVSAEGVDQGKPGSHGLLLPVEGELRADGLEERGLVVEVEEELADLDLLGVGGLVSEANEHVAGGREGGSEVVLGQL